MTPGASPGAGGGHGGGGKGGGHAARGGYSGSIGSCGYPQTKVSQEPRYDNCVRKRKKKKKHEAGDTLLGFLIGFWSAVVIIWMIIHA
jgi:hypothetical protein